MPGSVHPVEWGLPLTLFTSYQLAINCGGREQLFSGGTNTPLAEARPSNCNNRSVERQRSMPTASDTLTDE
jgi:hypothetical protein